MKANADPYEAMLDALGPKPRTDHVARMLYDTARWTVDLRHEGKKQANGNLRIINLACSRAYVPVLGRNLGRG